MPADALLSVRVTKDVQEAYSLVQDYYEINQSDLVRMAPLLLVLLAEKNFTDRRKDIKAAEESLGGNPSASEALKIYRENLRFRGLQLIEYLRESAEKLDPIGRDAVRGDDIDLGKDGLPQYRLFHKIRMKQSEIMDEATLERVAAVAARDLVKDVHSVLRTDDPYIPPEYDGPLLALARAKLGKLLTDDQKRKVRQLFKDAVHAKPGGETPSERDRLEQVAQEIADSVSLEANLNGEYIPPEYDGRLLAIARAKLGRHLTAEQKAKVRQLLREKVAERKNAASR